MDRLRLAVSRVTYHCSGKSLFHFCRRSESSVCQRYGGGLAAAIRARYYRAAATVHDFDWIAPSGFLSAVSGVGAV